MSKILTRKKTLRFLSILGVFTLIGALFLRLAAGSASAAWFDDSYGYRQTVSFTHNADISSDRRIRLNVNTAMLISSGKMQTDCDDSRFTDINGKLLRYQLVSGCNSPSTSYDVVVPQVFNGANTLYFYYANPSAVSASEDVSAVTSLTPSGGAPASSNEEKGPSPVLYLKFDEGNGTTSYDSTANANNALLGTVTIEQQVNINDQEYTTTSASTSPTDNSLGLIQFDSTDYTGDTPYFEAVVKKTDGTPTVNTVGAESSIVCPSPDDCKIAYRDTTDTSLRFFDCDDASCTTGTMSIVDGATGCGLTGCSTSASAAGASFNMVCPSASDCKILYTTDVGGNLDLYLADCDAATCNVGTVTLLDGNTGCSLTGCDTSRTFDNLYLDCPSSDNCKAAYTITAVSDNDVYFADCANATCSSGTTTLIDGNTGCSLSGCTNANIGGWYIDVKCPSGNDCKVAYYSTATTSANFADCDSETCSSGTTTPIDGTTSCSLTGCSDTADTGYSISLACPATDNCKVVYSSTTLGNADVYFGDCDNATCSSGTRTLLDGTTGCALSGCDSNSDRGEDGTSIYCPSATDCKITYKEAVITALYFADCNDGTAGGSQCDSGTVTTLDGTSGCSLTGCDTADDSGIESSISCSGGAADCKVTYRDATGNDLMFADCSSATCNQGVATNVDDGREYVWARLYTDTGTAVADGVVMTSSSSYTRVRTNAALSMSTDEYTVRTNTSEDTNVTAAVRASRLAIVQEDSTKLTDTQTQVEIGNAQNNFSNTTYSTLTDHKIYLFDTDKFSGSEAVYFEATIHTDSGANTVSAQLLRCTSVSDCATGTAVTGSEVTKTTDTNWARVRSSDISANMTDDSNYAVQVKMTAGTGDIANAKIIIDQTTSGGITDVEVAHEYINTLATDSDSTYTDQDYLNRYNPNNFTNGTFTKYFESTLKTTSTTTGYAQLWNDTDGSAIASSEVSTTNTTYTRLRSADIGANLPASAKNLDTQAKNSAAGTTSAASSWLIIQASGLSTGSIAARWKTEEYCLKYNCLLFDGTDDAVWVTNSDSIDMDRSLSGALAFQMWVRVNSDGETDVGQIFNKGPNTYIRVASEGTDRLADLQASLDLASTDATLTVTDGITLDRWHYIVMTYSDDGDDEITIYIDGKSRGSSTNGSGSLAADANNLLIGGPTTANFHGFIDEFKIYKEERSNAQILTDFQRLSGLHGSQASFGERNYSTLSEGLVGYWKLDETSGNAADSSGNGTTLTNNSSTSFTTAKFGRGAEFDGSTDFFDAADNTTLSITGSLTLSAWIEPDDITGSETIIAKWGATESYLLTKEAANLRLYLNSTSNYEATTGNPLTANTKIHVAAVYDAVTQTIRLFVNGALQTSSTTGTVPASITDNTNEFSLAAEDTDGTAANFFDGHIDDARLYKRSLSPAEVEMLYNFGPGQIGYWKMDEASANTCSGGINDSCDSSTNGNDAAWNGNATSTDGKYGSGVTFDGTGDYVEAPDIDL